MAERRVRTVFEVVDQATDKLQKIEQSTSSLKVVSLDAFLNIGRRALDAVKAIAKFTISGLKAADAMGDMAKQLGVSTDLLATLELAAVTSGSSLQEIQVGLRTLQQRAKDANDGLAESIRSFRRLGVSVIDATGELRGAEDLLPDIADAFTRLTSSTEKTALAQEIFGRSGVALVPIFEKGRAGLNELRAEADRLGLTFGQETAQGADEVADSLAVMELQVTALARELGITLLPAIKSIIKGSRETIAVFTEFTQGIGDLIDRFNTLGIAGLIAVNKGVLPLFRSFKNAEQAAKDAGVSTEDLSRIMLGFRQALENNLPRARAYIAELKDLTKNQQQGSQAVSQTSQAYIVTQEVVNNLGSALSDFTGVQLADIEKTREARIAQFDEFIRQQELEGQSFVDLQLFRQQILGEGRAREIELEAQHVMRLQQEIDTARVTDVVKRHQQEQVALDLSLAQQNVSEGKAAAARLTLSRKQSDEIIKIQQAQAQQIAEIGTQLGDILVMNEAERGNAFKAFLKNFVSVKIKELAIAALTQIGIAQVGAPLSFGATLLAIPAIAAAQALATGLLNAIAFQHGGKIPGFGGGDTQPILAERGEFVVNKDSTARFEPVLQRINAMGRFQGGGRVDGAGGLTLNIGTVENLSDFRYVELLAEKLSDLVRHRGGTLVASAVTA